MTISKEIRAKKFIDKCITKYGNTFDYSKVNYVRSDILVTIGCNVCGNKFEQSPANHVYGFNGCKTCVAKNVGDRYRKSQEKCIEDFKKVHGDKYDYSLVEYVNWKTKVKIICPIHGVFEQEPNSHKSGCGCRSCSHYHQSRHGVNIPDLDNTEITFYVAEFKSEKYSFIKIGITSFNFKKRFQYAKYKHYDKTVLMEIKLPSKIVINLESITLKAFQNYRYHITHTEDSFKGVTEIFKLKSKDLILDFVNEQLKGLQLNEQLS